MFLMWLHRRIMGTGMVPLMDWPVSFGPNVSYPIETTSYRNSHVHNCGYLDDLPLRKVRVDQQIIVYLFKPDNSYRHSAIEPS